MSFERDELGSILIIYKCYNRQGVSMAEIVCTSCGYVGEPKTITKGSMAVELVLWLLLIVPGLIYSVWRLTSRHEGCPSCGQTALIPVESPMGKKFLRENFPDRQVGVQESPRAPSGQARSVGRAAGRLVGRLLK